MNIFFLEYGWDVCAIAAAYGDKHVVKIILELAQMLYCAHHGLNKDESWQSKAPDGG
jgi:hypothetical protein